MFERFCVKGSFTRTSVELFERKRQRYVERGRGIGRERERNSEKDKVKDREQEKDRQREREGPRTIKRNNNKDRQAQNT